MQPIKPELDSILFWMVPHLVCHHSRINQNRKLQTESTVQYHSIITRTTLIHAKMTTSTTEQILKVPVNPLLLCLLSCAFTQYHVPWPLSPPSVVFLHFTGRYSAAAICEWILVMLFFCLFGLFAAEFRHVDCHQLTVQKGALERDHRPSTIEVNGYVTNTLSWTGARMQLQVYVVQNPQTFCHVAFNVGLMPVH